MLYYSKCITLHFPLLQLLRLTDQCSTFFERWVNHLIGQCLPSSAVNKKEIEHGKYSLEVHSGRYRAWYLKRIFKITIWVSWCQNKLVYVTGLRRHVSVLALLRYYIVKKQLKHFFLSFGFINVNFFVTKDRLSGLRQFFETESLLKMMKNAFHFTLKAFFVLQIFQFLSWLFGNVD